MEDKVRGYYHRIGSGRYITVPEPDKVQETGSHVKRKRKGVKAQGEMRA